MPRVLPLALVIGLFGASQADTAGAFGPAILVSITVSPAVASIAQGDAQQFTATGTYSNLTTQDLTDTVTWSSSASGTATVSNTPGSQGVATGIDTGVATVTAKDASAFLSGTAALTVTPALPTVPTTLPTVPTTLPTVPTTLPTVPTTLPTVPTIPTTLPTVPTTLPTLPVLVTVTVSPTVANVAVGADEQFTATGAYSDLSTQDLTDSVTWSSSSSSTATVSNKGVATGIADGVATITATDPTAPVSGTAALTVTPVVVPVSPAPSVPQLALSPPSGARNSTVIARGAGFSPGQAVIVTYLSGLKARKRASTVLCRTAATANGTFSCHGTIPRLRRSGKPGKHTIEATGPTGGKGNASFDLVRPRHA